MFGRGGPEKKGFWRPMMALLLRSGWLVKILDPK
jgi:hypothetical protein